ncbi:MAG: carotenoid biosynthesis protein [Thermoplasmatota archaeon]
MKERMMAFRDKALWIMAILFFVGSIGHVLDVTRNLMLLLTPIFLLSMGLLVLLPDMIGRRYILFLWVLVTYLITFALEAVGVATGAVFGDYSYGSTLGPELFEVPVVIGFNWVIVIMGSSELVGRFVRHRLAGALSAGLAAMLFDIALEPVAMELDYWDWAGGTIPVQNYIAWFVIAAIMAYSYQYFGSRYGKKLLIAYLFLQTLLFLIIRVMVIGG